MSEEITKDTSEEPKVGPTPEVTKEDGPDVERNRAMAIIGYILPILFFVPLLSEKKSPFGVFHANQQLVLLISAIAVRVFGVIVPIIGWFLILPLGSLAVLALAIIGLIGAAKGETKPLPVIGGISIIK